MEDKTVVKAATVKTLGAAAFGGSLGYLRDLDPVEDDDWDDDDARYGFARAAWERMARAPKDGAASQLQRRVRDTSTAREHEAL